MVRIAPEYVEYQRRRWMRPDAHRYMRPDAGRYLLPEMRGSAGVPPQAKLPPAEVAAARVWLAALRRDLIEIKSLLAVRRALVAAWRLQQSSHLLARKAGFDPNQLRDELGRWTDTGDENGLTSGARSPNRVTPVGQVIWVCTASGISLFETIRGKSYAVVYDCPDGR